MMLRGRAWDHTGLGIQYNAPKHSTSWCITLAAHADALCLAIPARAFVLRYWCCHVLAAAKCERRLRQPCREVSSVSVKLICACVVFGSNFC